jgi:hypothetical protein
VANGKDQRKSQNLRNHVSKKEAELAVLPAAEHQDCDRGLQNGLRQPESIKKIRHFIAHRKHSQGCAKTFSPKENLETDRRSYGQGY